MFYHNLEEEKKMVIPCNLMHDEPKPIASTLEDVIRKI